MRRPNSFGKRGVGALTCVGALALSACAKDAPQDYLQPVGEIAKKIDSLWDLVFLIATIVFFLVEGLLVYALIKFRRREGVEARQFHGNTKVEVILTVIPALILAGIAIPTLKTLFDVTSEPTGANVLQITVTGHQFWWEYDYPSFDVKAANELHIPTGTTVRLTLLGDTTNRLPDPDSGVPTGDVIHSFWVPRLAGKQDVVPGREAKMTLLVNEPGEYLGQCTEFCGLSHANMRLKVFAHPPAEFMAWIAEQQRPAQDPADPLAQEGRDLFLAGACAGCHTIDGTDASGTIGPNLTHFASRTTFAGATFERTDENLAAWLADPPGVKPGSKMPDLGLSQDEIQKLIAYLQSLR